MTTCEIPTRKKWFILVCAVSYKLGAILSNLPHAVTSISKKYAKAIISRETALDMFNDFSGSVDEGKQETWAHQEKLAMILRGDHLKIYDVVAETGL